VKQIDRLKGKGLIRSLNRKGASFDKKPAVARRGGVFREPSVCERCGAVYEHSRWRRGGNLSGELLERAAWVDCPACAEAKSGLAYGKVVIAGDFARDNLELIRRRIANVERRATFTQPERKVLSLDWNGKNLEVLTTSQKLAHRIAREMEKLFGGRAKYSWSDNDGSLFATWSAAER
jgi:hypothetical protein